MLKVFYLSDEELERASYGWQGRVCPAYVITKKGERIDVDRLTEQQILSFVKQGIDAAALEKKQQAVTPENRSDFNPMHYEGTRQVNSLLYLVEDRYRPSLQGMRIFVDLLHNQDDIVRNLAQKTVLKTAQRGDYEQIVKIAEYLRAARGADNAPLNQFELQSVITQMQTNEFTIPVDHLLPVEEQTVGGYERG